MIRTGLVLLLLNLSLHLSVMADENRSVISITIGHENTGLSDIIEKFQQQTGIQVVTRVLDNANLKVELLKRSNTRDLPDAALIPADFLGLSDLNFSVVDPTLINLSSG